MGLLTLMTQEIKTYFRTSATPQMSSEGEWNSQPQEEPYEDKAPS